MSEEDDADFKLLSLANDEHYKFAVQLGYLGKNQGEQDAFERGLHRGWYTLIDLSPMPTATGDMRLMRVFMLTEAGRSRLADLRKRKFVQ